MNKAKVIAIKAGFYGGCLREPGTRTEVFEVPEDQADTSPWWKPVDGYQKPAAVVVDEPRTMSEMAQELRGGKKAPKHAEEA